MHAPAPDQAIQRNRDLLLAAVLADSPTLLLAWGQAELSRQLGAAAAASDDDKEPPF